MVRVIKYQGGRKIKRLVVVLAMVFMSGCGGGGSDSASAPSVTSVKTSQVGKYSLSQITEQVSHAAVPFTAYSSWTSTPPAWTGALKVGNTSWDMVQSATGQTSNINGTYNFIYDVPYQSGSFALTIPGYYPMYGRYNIMDDYTLKLTYNYSGAAGRYVQWVETWHKDSDTL
jgi:hypothetical protein